MMKKRMSSKREKVVGTIISMSLCWVSISWEKLFVGLVEEGKLWVFLVGVCGGRIRKILFWNGVRVQDLG